MRKIPTNLLAKANSIFWENCPPTAFAVKSSKVKTFPKRFYTRYHHSVSKLVRKCNRACTVDIVWWADIAWSVRIDRDKLVWRLSDCHRIQLLNSYQFAPNCGYRRRAVVDAE
ncbi:MAG: hypothetical protein RMK18_10475 [Armatimonadota bacterium]|nr:hypothetical protein [Armatimonadota bacterium]MDW8026270.1 hypothetical protein [Armatimonadota bacterium]